jgi:deoxyadenosine/deoxycytidine kinase
MAPQIFSIEGNIGTGKSTFLDELKKHYKDNARICFLEEPVNVWTSIMDEHGVNIIEKYYQNQKRYAFSFQMMAYISRLSSLKRVLEQDKYDVIIMERSLYTDCNVFAKMLYNEKKIEEIEYAIYKKWYYEFIKEFPPITFVYLRAKPTLSFERVLKRNRQGETIPLEYLENCHNYHDDWLLNNINNSIIIILDANIDITNKPDTIKEWIVCIEKSITDHSKWFKWRNITDIAYYIQTTIRKPMLVFKGM